MILNLKWLSKSCWITLPILGYFSLHFDAICDSSYNNALYNWLLFFLLATIDFVLIQYTEKIPRVAKSISYTFFLIFLFGTNLNDLLNAAFSKLNEEITIPGRYIAFFFLVSIFYIQLKINTKVTAIKFQNSFWLIFCGIQFFQQIMEYKNAPPLTFKSSYWEGRSTNKKKKNILLLILDEYSSPLELSRSTTHQFTSFTDRLNAHGWITKNQFNSYEVSTIHSLGSLFNFNLSKNKSFSDANPWQIAETYFLRAPRLSDSLHTKYIKIINWGILDLGESKKLSRLYYYPTNYFQLISSFTILPSLQIKGRAFNFAGINLSLYPSEMHNKKLIDLLKNKLHQLDDQPHFIYAHLFMPHSPILYSPYIKKDTYNVEHYVSYWNFTNTLLTPVLDSFEKNPNLKVIITGDHGLRNIDRINPHNTFAAFWGFQKEEIDQLTSVQDIGSLINSCY